MIGAGIGTALYLLHAPRRRVVRINIERCFPSLSRDEQRKIVLGHFRVFGQSLTDMPIAWWAGQQRLKRLVRFVDRHHFDDALAARRNVILLAPHFVGLEIGGVRLSIDTPFVTVFRHPDNRIIRTVMEQSRARFGVMLVEHNRPFTSLVRAIKSGTPLYYLPDQDAGRRHSVFAPFFGIPAATFTALSRLAAMTDAIVVPCITYRRRWGMGYEVVFRPPLANFPSGDAFADTALMNAEIERAVWVRPEQYFWLHKRFKTRPVGEPRFY